MQCAARYFERVTDAKVRWLPWESIRVDGTSRIDKSDFLKIECNQTRAGGRSEDVAANHRRSWSSLFLTAVRNESRAQELHEVGKDWQRQPEGAKWSGLNVYVLGFDSLSQMSFRRNMPLTVNYFEKEMGASVLNGFNIVGDGTPQVGGDASFSKVFQKFFKGFSKVCYPFILFGRLNNLTAFFSTQTKLFSL